MELGRCPRCTMPYTSADVVGLGILRARPAAAGGPRIDYRCPGCGRVLVLVPHGEGRYAAPGEPPPPSVPPPLRRPAWVAARAPTPDEAPSAPPESEEPPPLTIDEDPAQPLSLEEARALLGLEPSAGTEELERAFRARALGCHPDKVAHLDSALQALAERRFKRLRQAHELLQAVLRPPR